MTSNRSASPALKTGGKRSEELFERARSVFPGGITRATVERDPFPVFADFGEGAYLTDVDGRRFLDLNNNFTTLIHGHGFPPVVEATAAALRRGTCFANPMRHEIELAELLVDRIPAVEKIRFVTSGTDAVMFAIKAARAATGRTAVARLAGAYHGAYDWAEAGQKTAGGMPVSSFAGTPSHVLDDVIVIDFNDIDDLKLKVEENSHRLAALLFDPMPSRAGFMRPHPEFLETVNLLAKKHGVILIADEVLNLRQGFHGASHRYGLEPDLITMGKIIGGGFPIGAVGGRAEVMSLFASDDKIAGLPQGGTFAANPVSMMAGKVAMESLTRATFERLEDLGDRVRGGLASRIAHHGAAFFVTGAASLFRIHASSTASGTVRQAHTISDDEKTLSRLHRHFAANGIILPRGAAASLSTPMSEADADQIISVFDDFLVSDLNKAGEAA
ncbi:aspartate aminotransferase family protein [Agrobacterium sp. fls2-241-TYG-188a]|uniref:aspartate aminotransferase family protein n=1 Tax=Agrobacterium sp. fls2-241-TYG-188a TaxID=3040275 RepID=UPI00254CCD0D|nr:aspartate aminotransferase family protein [Agrobacterium sp. fls2-241-TYG-188a]